MHIGGINIDSRTVAKATLATCAAVHLAGTTMLTMGAPVNVEDSVNTELHRDKRHIHLPSAEGCTPAEARAEAMQAVSFGIFGFLYTAVFSKC